MIQLVEFDTQSIIDRINHENAMDSYRLRQRRREGMREARRLTAFMREAMPNIRLIIGFGSVFEKRRGFRMDSDINMAFEGGDLACLLHITRDSLFTVDLIDIENRDDTFAQLIRKNGYTLYKSCSRIEQLWVK